jgi:hypothetical protein
MPFEPTHFRSSFRYIIEQLFVLFKYQQSYLTEPCQKTEKQIELFLKLNLYTQQLLAAQKSIHIR